MTPSFLLGTAQAAGWPRAEVTVPGRRSPVPVEPSRDGWERFASWFTLDPVALSAGVLEVARWECFVRGQLAVEEVGHAT